MPVARIASGFCEITPSIDSSSVSMNSAMRQYSTRRYIVNAPVIRSNHCSSGHLMT